MGFVRGIVDWLICFLFSLVCLFPCVKEVVFVVFKYV